ncbi:MAG: hypothetical protein IKP88_01840, partial [Lachnospiraceae bacterium]|nr:hypothetical protein [Lachnospiraceae bacterium]
MGIDERNLKGRREKTKIKTVLCEKGIGLFFFSLFLSAFIVAGLMPGKEAKAEDDYVTNDNVAINAENFPDDDFRDYVSEHFDSDGDGTLSVKEVKSAKSVYMYYDPDVPPSYMCYSLSGIEFLTSLESITVKYQSIKTLDVTNNTKLVYLECKDCGLESLNVTSCPKLEELYCPGNDLESLDIISCPRLETLSCNYNLLTSLNIASCPELTKIECEGNQLTSLDLSACSKLRRLICNDNQITTLDLSPCPELRRLECNDNQITTLNVTSCPELRELECNDNQITTLDLTSCPILTELYCFNNQISSLDIVSCPVLFQLDCRSNPMTKLNIANCRILCYLYEKGSDVIGEYEEFVWIDLEVGDDEYIGFTSKLYFNPDIEIISYMPMEIREQPVDVAVKEEETATFIVNVAGTGLKYQWQVSKDDGKNWIDSNLSGYDKAKLSFTATKARNGYKFRCVITDKKDETIISDVVTLAVFANGEVYVCINEENFPDAIFRNYVSENFDTDYNGYLSKSEIAAIKEVDIEGTECVSLVGIEFLTSLEILYCEGNSLTTLDVSKNTKLEELFCGYNQITTLNVTGCSVLKWLDCRNNQLELLDITECLSLTNLYCMENKLKSLDITTCSMLASLGCSSNQIEALDLTGCPSLEDLYCGGNKLKSLDITSCTELIELSCENNQLESLNISSSPKLTFLNCWLNKIEFLDIASCPMLSDFTCGSNKIKTLATASCPELTFISCENNQIASLDITSCVKLESLYCYKNRISKLDISNCKYLCEIYDMGSTTPGEYSGWLSTEDGETLCVLMFDPEVEITSYVTLTIEEQPVDVTIIERANAEFSVKTVGTGLKYQWQVSKDGGNTWTDSSLSGYNTDTLTVLATKARNGYKFRCVVTDKKNTTVTSSIATLTVLPNIENVSIDEKNFPD